MRVFNGMLRWLSAGIFAIVFLLAAIPTNADTGTYRIADYIVSLEPQSSGKVRITYEQKWEVLSGNIPWITVGLPNSNFSVEEFSGAASKVYANNSGGWYGVRVDLDKDYLPGETVCFHSKAMQLDSAEAKKMSGIVYRSQQKGGKEIRGLCEMPCQKGNEERQTNNHEERQTSNPRSVSRVWDQDVQDRAKLKS